MVQKAGRPLSRLRHELPERHITPDLRIPCGPERAGAFLAHLREAYPPERVAGIDGVRVSFTDGWALARMSITEPKIALRFEGDSAQALQRIIEEFARQLPELDAHLRREPDVRGE